MPKHETSSHIDDVFGDAFEYVSGTLRGDERQRFEAKLREECHTDNEPLSKEVKFWEEQLMDMQDVAAREPKMATWKGIETSLAGNSTKPTTTIVEKITRPWWQWVVPSCAAMMLAVVLVGYQPGAIHQPLTDYVAVLTDQAGDAKLTTLASEQVGMWLKWENVEVKPDTNMQLWAISKRDGQPRSIAVFSNTDEQKMALSEAHWRLVTDSKYLILTEEEPGGSPFDEPSATLLAKGVCVRFAPNQKTI